MSKTTITGINREVYNIPANSLKTISYNDVNPNYFHIQNTGEASVYFSAHSIPTRDLYDMKIDGGSISTFTDPYPQSEVYLLNDSNKDINVIVSTFSAPFDPSVLAFMNKSFSVSGQVETDGIVKDIKCPLPSGTNTIGKVDLSGDALRTLQNINVGTNLTADLTAQVNNLDIKIADINRAIKNLETDVPVIRDYLNTITMQNDVIMQGSTAYERVTNNFEIVQGYYFDLFNLTNKNYSKLKEIHIFNSVNSPLYLQGNITLTDNVGNVEIIPYEMNTGIPFKPDKILIPGMHKEIKIEILTIYGEAAMPQVNANCTIVGVFER